LYKKVKTIITNAAIIVIFAGCINEPSISIENTISEKYILDFWDNFKSLNTKNMQNFYEKDILLLRNSLLRSPKLGLDKSNNGSAIFSKDDLFLGYQNLPILISKKQWKLFFNSKYRVDKNTIEISKVKDYGLFINSVKRYF